MTTMVAKSNRGCAQVASLSVQEKGSRNKRKFRADPPLSDPCKALSFSQSGCHGYEFSAEKYQVNPVHGEISGCDMCGVNEDHSNDLTLDLGLHTATGFREEDELHDADWSDLTETQLEELVLSNLDAIFKTAIKNIISNGYTEEVATKAVLRSGICYGNKDIVCNIVDNALAYLRNGQEVDPSKEPCFEDLQQLEKYVLVELVCILQEVRPFFSTGDALWCLLLSDMNVSHACSMDGDSLNSLMNESASNPTQHELKPEAKTLLPFKATATRKTNTKREFLLRQKSSSLRMKPIANCSCPVFPYEKKEEMILKLYPRLKDLQSQLQEWTEWANQKVMQAARRLSKEKAELKVLRQEKEEVERLKREKKALEENTMKKLSEMENALSKANGQVGRANITVLRLGMENTTMRKKMEAAKVRAVESSLNCEEAKAREKKTLVSFQSWEKQMSVYEDDLAAERGKFTQLQNEVEQAMAHHLQLEARCRQEEKLKDELVSEAKSIRKEREDLELSALSREESVKSKAEASLAKYKTDIQTLEKQISELRLKTDSSKIAALRRGIDFSNTNTNPHSKSKSGLKKGLKSDHGGVKRERECAMCLSEEMSVVFLPCAHQVVCTTCNELHEKQGMKDCPSCRSTIQRRICVRYARP